MDGVWLASSQVELRLHLNFIKFISGYKFVFDICLMSEVIIHLFAMTSIFLVIVDHACGKTYVL